MNEQSVCMCGLGLRRSNCSLVLKDVSKCAKLKLCLKAITPPSIHTGTCCLSASASLLEGIRGKKTKKRNFTASDPASFFPYEQAYPLPRHTPPVKPASLLGKYGKRTEEVNFIAPFSLPLLIDKSTALTPRDFSSPITLREEGKMNFTAFVYPPPI